MRFLFSILSAIVVFASCNIPTVGLFEKTEAFPKHEWRGDDSLSFSFNVTDTIHPYQMFFVLRHTDAYHFRNIWVNITVQDTDTTYTIRREFKLADGEKWLGSGMGDIYEHRIPFSNNSLRFKAGTYKFTIQQIMREEPLANVLNAGIRLQRSE